jgi:cell division protein FtsZ
VPARRPQVQLINTQGRRDATTGMMIDEPAAFTPGAGIAANLRGRGSDASTPAAADFGSDSSYLDIPAFLRRQAD